MRTTITARAVLFLSVVAGETALGATPPSAPPAVVDLAAGEVHVGTASFRIDLPHERLPAADAVVVEAVPVARGKTVVHVRVPAGGAAAGPPVAWELLAVPGRKEALFAGVTGYREGDVGERTGEAVELRVLHEKDGSASKRVAVGTIREDLQICGEPLTLLSPRVLQPSSLELVQGPFQRLSEASLSSAEALGAAPATVDTAPHAELLRAHGSSVEGESGLALFDGDPSTTWTPAGEGEFVLAAVSSSLPVARLRFTLAPSSVKGAAPRKVFIVADNARYLVPLPPAGASRESVSFDVKLPKELRTTCLAIVQAEMPTGSAKSGLAPIADVQAFSPFDDAPLAAAAQALSGTSGRADDAASYLTRAGGAGFDAVASAWSTLDARGRGRAVAIAAASVPCERGASLYAKGAADPDPDLARKAQERLDRCGERGLAAMLEVVASDASARVVTARNAARVGGVKALPALAALLGAGDAATRAALRGAVTRAAHDADRDALAPLLAAKERPKEARVDLLRAIAGRLAVAQPESGEALEALLRDNPSFAERYLLLEPLAALAQAGDAGAKGRLASFMASDPDAPIRAHAVALSLGVRELAPAILRALSDPEPRVREAALSALSALHVTGIDDVVLPILRSDRWTFVRLAALDALAAAPASHSVDEELIRAVEHDASSSVRARVVGALAARGVSSAAPLIRERLEDPIEETAVRAAAARALGQLCFVEAVSDLTDLANELVAPDATTVGRELALAALSALGRIHPEDLASRIAPLTGESAPSFVRAEAARVRAVRDICR